MTIAKVLLTDDEKPFVETMMKRLNKRDIDVVPAFDGKEALKKLEEDGSIEVVILDIKMPVMDGMTTLKEIKSRHPLVEVIMLTGHATVESGIEGMKMGAFDYLMKPCDMDQLLVKVEDAAKHKRQHEQKGRVPTDRQEKRWLEQSRIRSLTVPGRIAMAKKDSIQADPIRLLLIDDEVGYVNVLSNRLSKRNFQVGKAHSASEAFQIMRKRDFDVAVLDLKMEDMDGIEILKILKKMAPELVVIMLTGHGSAEAAQEGIKQVKQRLFCDYRIKGEL